MVQPQPRTGGFNSSLDLMNMGGSHENYRSRADSGVGKALNHSPVTPRQPTSGRRPHSRSYTVTDPLGQDIESWRSTPDPRLTQQESAMQLHVESHGQPHGSMGTYAYDVHSQNVRTQRYQSGELPRGERDPCMGLQEQLQQYPHEQPSYDQRYSQGEPSYNSFDEPWHDEQQGSRQVEQGGPPQYYRPECEAQYRDHQHGSLPPQDSRSQFEVVPQLSQHMAIPDHEQYSALGADWQGDMPAGGPSGISEDKPWQTKEKRTVPIARRQTSSTCMNEIMSDSPSQSTKPQVHPPSPEPCIASRGHHHFTGGTQNQGNMLGDRCCVRQSKLYRQHESGNSMKNIMGHEDLKWEINALEGAYAGQAVYDHDSSLVAQPSFTTCGVPTVHEDSARLWDAHSPVKAARPGSARATAQQHAHKSTQFW